MAGNEITRRPPSFFVVVHKPHFIERIEQRELNEQRDGGKRQKQQAADHVTSRAAHDVGKVAVDMSAEGGNMFGVAVDEDASSGEFGGILMVIFQQPSSGHDVEEEEEEA